MKQLSLSFESRGVRSAALLVFFAIAAVSPSIPLPGGLPAVRLEQLWLALLLPPLGLYIWRHPETRRVLLLDWAFLALGIATALTLAIAPMIVDDVARSSRDVFELARIVEYWLAFRLTLVAWDGQHSIRSIALVSAVAVAVSSLAAAVQYLDPGTFNEAITGIWANSHNLDAVVKHGRAVGFVGNPNYFGMFCGLLLAYLIACQALGIIKQGRLRWLIAAGVALATAGMILSQSRTATFATMGALGLGLVWSLVNRRHPTSYAAPILTVVIAATATVGFAEVFPPSFGTLHDRFNLNSIGDDSALTLRITKWRNLLQSVFSDPPDICTGEPLDSRKIPGQEASNPTGQPAAEVAARDERRQEDIRKLSGSILKYYCDKNHWPVGDVESLLVPGYLPALPRDPSTGEPYSLYVTTGGFEASAKLEHKSSPIGPTFALGTFPNYVINSGFEHGGPNPSSWLTANSVDGRAAATIESNKSARFGSRAIIAHIPGGGSFYQPVVQDFPRGQEFTVNIWGRALDADEEVLIYIAAITADGTIVDPLAKSDPITLVASEWRPASLTFTLPKSTRMDIVTVLLRSPSDADPIEAMFDAITMTPGPLVPSYTWVRQASAAERKGLPGLADSPLIGVGPQKEAEIGALDNEYALFLDRYGLTGTAAYLFLFGAAFLAALKASRSDRVETAALGLGLSIGIVAMMVFSVAAGVFYNFQLMALFWPLVGSAVAARAAARSQEPVSGP